MNRYTVIRLCLAWSGVGLVLMGLVGIFTHEIVTVPVFGVLLLVTGVIWLAGSTEMGQKR